MTSSRPPRRGSIQGRIILLAKLFTLRAAWPDTLYRTRVYFTGALTLTVR